MSRLAAVASDARFAMRLLVRAPTFALTLLGVLVLGIGTTTAVFSIVQALLLRPLPFSHPEELTVMWKTYEPVARDWPASIPDLADLRAENRTFSSIAASGWGASSLASDDQPAEYVAGAVVSGEFFSMLDVRPSQGRLIGPDDDRVGAPRACVISTELWRRRFASDPSIVGRVVTLDSRQFTIVGVGPEGFRFGGPKGDRTDVWLPLAQSDGYAERSQSRGWNAYRILGRRKPGVTVAQAQADMNEVATRLSERHTSWQHRGIWVVDLHDALVGSAKETALVLFGAVVLVFLVVCANVASLLLARGATRRAEMAARAALGATRERLVAQLVTEAVVVFLLGGAGGALAAAWLVDFFANVVSHRVWAANIAFHVDGVAVGFAIVVALACGVAFGIGPALATSRVEPQVVLKQTSAAAGISRRQRLVRGALVVAQVAMAFSLLAGSGLALRAFAKTASTPPGFDPTGLASGRVALPDTKYVDEDHVRRVYEDLVDRLAKEPGVIAVAGNSAMPMTGTNSNGWFKIEGRPAWPGKGPIMERNVVTPGYFAAMGIPILRGRDFTKDDRAGGRRVVVISQRAAEKFFPGEDPIGRRIDLMDHKGDDDVWLEIVGVAADVRKVSLAADVPAEAYTPIAQHPIRWMTFAVRAATGEAMLGRMRAIVRDVDPELALFSRQMMQDRVDESYEEQRFMALLLTAFALAALVLATVGLFGLVAYTTGQRTRELGIRLALGSTPGEVVALVVRGGAALVAVGIVLGLAGALLIGRALAKYGGDIAAFDPLVFTAIPALLALAGVGSCLAPALRAVRIPPSVALRYE
ncbi:MAG: ABC transporter permease [Deltaproteobacteria bacterium]|nr:ABC transporter permease [Deltaproteobacteria bacterium]